MTAHHIYVPESHSTNFVPSSKPPKIEAVKPIEVTPAPRKIRVDLQESKPKNPDNALKGILVIYLCGHYLLITMFNLYN